jgi:hypothetical protein
MKVEHKAMANHEIRIKLTLDEAAMLQDFFAEFEHPDPAVEDFSVELCWHVGDAMAEARDA